MISSLDTTPQNIAASRQIAKIEKREKEMLKHVMTGVNSASDLIDNLYGAFSHQVLKSGTNLQPLRKDITAQKMLAEQSFQLLQNAVDSDEKVANNLIEETKSVARKLEQQIDGRTG